MVMDDGEISSKGYQCGTTITTIVRLIQWSDAVTDRIDIQCKPLFVKNAYIYYSRIGLVVK